MAEFPQLLEEDFHRFDAVMKEFLVKSEATLALIVEKAGYLIQQAGNAEGIDTTTLATLASNAYNATEFMAGIINEPGFSGMYEQGEQVSTLILKIDENALLVVIFPASLGVGAVKHFTTGTVQEIAQQLVIAQQRNPDIKIDLTDMDATDVQGVFLKKQDVP